MSKKENKISGNAGEELAAEYLVSRGYAIRERNFRVRSAEVDIIVEKKRAIVFVEVKYRATEAFGDPLEAVNPKKQSKIVHAAKIYLSMHKLEEREVRFDVVAILGSPYRVTHLEGAFVAEQGRR